MLAELLLIGLTSVAPAHRAPPPSVAILRVLSVRNIRRIEPLRRIPNDLTVMYLYRVDVALERQYSGRSPRHRFTVNLTSRDAAYLRGPGRILMSYRLNGRRVDALNWRPVYDQNNICMPRTVADELEIRDAVPNEQDHGEVCLPRVGGHSGPLPEVQRNSGTQAVIR